MPEWLAVLIMLFSAAAVMLAANMVLCFQAAMSGGGYPNRWYMLFFAALELIAASFQRSALTRILIFGGGIAAPIAVRYANWPHSAEARMVLFGGVIAFYAGLLVPMVFHPRDD